MKIGVVTEKQIKSSKGLQLGAASYVDPTAKIDAEIASVERTIRKYSARLAQLHKEREYLLAQKEKEE